MTNRASPTGQGRPSEQPITAFLKSNQGRLFEPFALESSFGAGAIDRATACCQGSEDPVKELAASAKISAHCSVLT
jgi:hypothetical protein